ncbi:hypothetical protein [Bifidobacterium felsineum]|uniref:hypothetical protein n=1 Tax=Bifidobacterium felsineum TaxID=2045440 RepID=UPI001BDBD416|nr:hypothetical protein [Bifidobacterium felsineum]MBT1165053.1 hypothetical protein [Bifidobacterium felsineum]
MNRKILYVRSGPYKLNLSKYNSQEVGLAKALTDLDCSVDILYYSDKNYDQIINYNDRTIKILWRKGIKIFRTGIYPSLLNQAYLKQYDAIICSEYSQLMSIILSKLHNNVYVYNGIYYNLFKLPFIEKFYDWLFVPLINKNVKGIFCKTRKAKKYLENKGINNLQVIGVGLDPKPVPKQMDKQTKCLLRKMDNHHNILFVGQLTKRKKS